MLQLLTKLTIDRFFANAGQAVVERSLMRALVETGNVRFRALAHGNDRDHERLAEFSSDMVAAGSLEIIPSNRLYASDLLAGMNGFLLHAFPDEFWPWFKLSNVMNTLPVFHHIHSFLLSSLDEELWRELWGDWQGWPPSLMIAPSHSTARRAGSLARQILVGRGKYPPVEVFPHGIYADDFRHGDRRAGRKYLGLDEDCLLILSLNRISPGKCDYKQLLLAFQRLCQSGSVAKHVRLAIVGGVSPEDEDYVRSLKRLASKLKIKKRVHFGGHFEESIKKDILAAADIFVSLASNPQESFGIVLLEALAAGLPIVATDWNGYPEVLPPFYKQFFVETIASHEVARVLNWKQLSDAVAPNFGGIVAQLLRFINEPQLRQELGKQGQKYVDKFSWRSIAEQFVGRWREIDELHRQGQHGSVENVSAEPNWLAASPVDGLATSYLSDKTRFRHAKSAPKLPALLRKNGSDLKMDKNMVSTLKGLCDGGIEAGTSMRALREANGLQVAQCEQLMLHLLRYGVLEVYDVGV
jgi:glycosyltransferase involved in cell wall biosynthesis